MRPLRPAGPAHASHDGLLIARLAGGDDLDARERAAADTLVADCPDCARLASDLVAISRAVAAEPVPPRRRDFRISPEQARQLRGSPFDRLRRRIVVPRTDGALRPLATGALSIGLVLVFVGSVVPRPTVSPAPAPVSHGLGEASDEAAPSVAALKVGPPPASEPEQRDTLAGADATSMQMTAPSEALASPKAVGVTGPAADAAVPEAASRSAEGALAVPSSAPAVAPLADDQANADLGLSAQDAAAQDAAAQESHARDTDAEDTAALDADGRPRSDEGVADEETPAVADQMVAAPASASTGLDAGAILVAVGVGLLAIGIVLVILLILARRHPDPARP